MKTNSPETMTTEADDALVTKTFKLTCTDCAFETTVAGSFHDALDVADDHQEKYGVAPTNHFVDLELSD